MTLGHPDLQPQKPYPSQEWRFAAIKRIEKNAVYDWAGLLKPLVLLDFRVAFSLSDVCLSFSLGTRNYGRVMWNFATS